MKIRHILTGIIAAVLVTACATQVQPAKSFTQELANQYRHLFIGGKSGDGWVNQQYFASKGQQVAKGKNILPENPDNWNIPSEKRAELNNAYDMLQIALVPDRKKAVSPIHAARAQAYFDCWVEQTQKRFVNTSRNNACRAAFYHEFCAMYSNKCYNASREEAMARQGRMFRIFFGTGSNKVNADGQKAIVNAVNAYTRGGHEILLAGHTDAVGSSNRNLELSKERAAAVRAELIDQGIPATNISENYFGENQPLVKTSKNVPSARNRRVLIVVR